VDKARLVRKNNKADGLFLIDKLGQHCGGQAISNEENDIRKQERETAKTRIITFSSTACKIKSNHHRG